MGCYLGFRADCQPPVKISTDGKAAVDPAYFWRKCDSSTPRGVKLQLINKAAGVAVRGRGRIARYQKEDLLPPQGSGPAGSAPS